MLNIGPGEVLVIALVALIFVGPDQLPGVLRRLGRSMSQLKTMADGLKREFMSGMEELDPSKWDEPRGKGTLTDPILGPGAYGPPADKSSPEPNSDFVPKVERGGAGREAQTDTQAEPAPIADGEPQDLPPTDISDDSGEVA